MKKRFFSDESAQNTRNKYIHAATEAPLLGRPAALGARVGGAAPHPGPRHRHQRFGRRGALLLGRGASFECRDAGAAEEIHVPMGIPQAACTWMHFAFECEAPEMVLEQQALAAAVADVRQEAEPVQGHDELTTCLKWLAVKLG